MLDRRDIEFTVDVAAVGRLIHLLRPLWPVPHWCRRGWWPRICTFHCRRLWLGRSSVSRPGWSPLPPAEPVDPPGSTQTGWGGCRGPGTAAPGSLQPGASPGRAGRWRKEGLRGGDKGFEHDLGARIPFHPSVTGPLTLHLHLGVRLAVAVLVGGVADVLPRILPPHAVQGQNSAADRVLPWQRGPELGPGNDGRRGAWDKTKTCVTEETGGRGEGSRDDCRAAYRWPGTPWWRSDPPPPSFLRCWPMPPALRGPPPRTVPLWSPLSLRCFWPGRCKRPSLPDGPRATEERGPLMPVTPPLELGKVYEICICIHLCAFTWMTLALFASLVTSCRVEPWRFQVILGRGLPVARHSTDTGSPILTRRGPAGVSCTLGATVADS